MPHGSFHVNLFRLSDVRVVEVGKGVLSAECLRSTYSGDDLFGKSATFSDMLQRQPGMRSKRSVSVNLPEVRSPLEAGGKQLHPGQQAQNTKSTQQRNREQEEMKLTAYKWR